MMLFGLGLIVIGAIFNLSLVWLVGVAFVLFGAGLALTGMLGSPVRGRRHYY